MNKRNLIIIFCILSSCLSEIKAQKIDRELKKLSDAPNDSHLQKQASNQIPYEIALQKWKTASDVSNWIKENFSYDIERAKQLAENSTTREKASIYSPNELYQIKKGVCIDLSRFAVETINVIDTSKHLQYLMIEFEPIIIDSSVIKKHWVAVDKGTSGIYILADSKRPGYIAGPYKTVEDFISDYQIFRDRIIVSWKILPTYQKRKKAMQQKTIRS